MTHGPGREIVRCNYSCSPVMDDYISKLDELVKSLILLAPQTILGFMTRLAKLQELGLMPSNSLQFLTPDSS